MRLSELAILRPGQVHGRRQDIANLPAAELVIEPVVSQPVANAALVDVIRVYVFEQLVKDSALVFGVDVFEHDGEVDARLDCWVEGFDPCGIYGVKKVGAVVN